MYKIKISTDFSLYPGARYYTDGKFSGQEFYENLLSIKFKEAFNSNQKLVVDLDGTAGYASSFLNESFGLLSREFGSKNVLNNLEIISIREPDWKEIILKDYIPNGPKRK